MNKKIVLICMGRLYSIPPRPVQRWSFLMILKVDPCPSGPASTIAPIMDRLCLTRMLHRLIRPWTSGTLVPVEMFFHWFFLGGWLLVIFWLFWWYHTVFKSKREHWRIPWNQQGLSRHPHLAVRNRLGERSCRCLNRWQLVAFLYLCLHIKL